jgi:hypothetical protein
LPLSDEEKAKIQEELHEEVERDLLRRQRALQTRGRREQHAGSSTRASSRDDERAAFREERRIALYKERGYELRTDSSGRERWLSPDEIAWLEQHPRRRRRHANFEIVNSPRNKMIAIYAVIGAVAVVAGILLSR